MEHVEEEPILGGTSFAIILWWATMYLLVKSFTNMLTPFVVTRSELSYITCWLPVYNWLKTGDVVANIAWACSVLCMIDLFVVFRFFQDSEWISWTYHGILLLIVVFPYMCIGFAYLDFWVYGLIMPV